MIIVFLEKHEQNLRMLQDGEVARARGGRGGGGAGGGGRVDPPVRFDLSFLQFLQNANAIQYCKD